MNLETFAVKGMNCQHCVASVTEEVELVPGVRAVAVDLPRGQITIKADRPIDARALRAAVELAGYRLMVPVAS